MSSANEVFLMRKVLNLFSMTAVVLSLCSPGFASLARAQDVPAGDAANGKRLYLATCFACHGRSGQGGAMNGPAPILAKTAMPFDGFKGQLRQPVSDMPTYSEAVMSDQQIADIFAFLGTLPGPLPVKDMAIFND
jgi:mono/diheme cytochrome c family protein